MIISLIDTSDDEILRLIKKDVLRTLPTSKFMRIPLVQKSLIRLLFKHSKL
jgi:hypothetical protein